MTKVIIMVQKDSFHSFHHPKKMELLISYKSGPTQELVPFPTDSKSESESNLKRKEVKECINVLRNFEKEFHFSFKKLRRLARSQLFILHKKYMFYDSPELYYGEIKKLMEFELHLER